MMQFLASWYIHPRVAVLTGAIAIPCAIGTIVPIFNYVALLYIVVLLALILVDAFLVGRGGIVHARRVMETRLSNGEDNRVVIEYSNSSNRTLKLTIIDELPMDWQQRDIEFRPTLHPNSSATCGYIVHPKRRGEFAFGNLMVYVTALGFMERRYVFEAKRAVSVYPSIINMRRIELAVVNRNTAVRGMKLVRRLGNTLEFEKIKQYVAGDDIRTINWRATARTSELMVNQYQDEISQDVYLMLDCGRVMRMPFNEMTLLDHSVNATLALANIVLRKYDRVGIVSYTHNSCSMLRSSDKQGQLGVINDALYKLNTMYLESDDRRMFNEINANVKTRSIMMLFTNIDSMQALRRRLPVLKQIARKHRLLVVSFMDAELQKYISAEATDTRDAFKRTMSRSYYMRKREIHAELRMYGIQSIYTRPEDLTVSAVNAYLQAKSGVTLS